MDVNLLSTKTKFYLVLLTYGSLPLVIRSILDNKVGHLLSEFSIEFALELWCQILLSKVTNKLSESWH